MSPEMEKALFELRKVICTEHPNTVRATVHFELNGRVEIEIEEKSDDSSKLFSLLLNLTNDSNYKKYYIKKTGEPYKGQIVLNCGKITDSFGNELIFI